MRDPHHFPEHVVRACALHNIAVERDPQAWLGVPLRGLPAAPFMRPDLVGDIAANDVPEPIAS